MFGNFSGAVTVNTGNLTLQGGSFSSAYAQIGHGGNTSAGNYSGAIAVNVTAGPKTEGLADEATATEVVCFARTVTVAVADFVSSATEVAVTVTVRGPLTAKGAV